MSDCRIKYHFDCDGTGQMCNVCGESSSACGCDDGDDFFNCQDCDGTGHFCVEHESPSGSLKGPCDKADKS